MRVTMMWIAAAALIATPAAAQNETADVNADVAVENVDTNATMPPANGMTADPANMAVAPAPAPAPVETAPAPARVQERRSFPWGIIGLVGLVGLLGRRRSSD